MSRTAQISQKRGARQTCRPALIGVALCLGAVGPAGAQAQVDPAVQACRATGLVALQQGSADITDLIFDMDSLAVSEASTTVEDVSVKKVILGEAYIKRGEKAAADATGAPDRFVCLIGEKGKVLLTFFTAK